MYSSICLSTTYAYAFSMPIFYTPITRILTFVCG